MADYVIQSLNVRRLEVLDTWGMRMLPSSLLSPKPLRDLNPVVLSPRGAVVLDAKMKPTPV